jgi:radical SAM superfamily enzyme YgiQ (UPF0313 family)
MTKKQGYPIVLCASRAEANSFENNPFAAFICTFPKKLSHIALKDYLDDLPTNDDGSAKRTIYGLRKVESLLIDAYGKDAVVVSHYNELDKFIGKDTKIVGISSMDPLGLAYVSTTYNSLIGFGGEPLNATEFKRLVTHPAIQKHRPTIIVGGAGAWQIHEAKLQEQLQIDVLYQGESEENLVEVMHRLLNNQQVATIIEAPKPNRAKTPLIKHAASYGMVEITRGCGRGCQFCSPTNRSKYSFPRSHIMQEVAVNVKDGCNTIFTVTEDIFLYKSLPGFIPNKPAIVELYKSIAAYPGVDYILLSHASIAPVIYDPTLLEELTPILIEKTKWNPNTSEMYKQSFISVEVGIETGSVRLMKKYMKGKALPYNVDNWPELVQQGIGIMNDHDWWPLCTIMTGQPDETEDDVRATLTLIDDLRNQHAKMFYTPVLFIPLKDALLSNSRRPSLDALSELQWEVLARCWRNNIDFWSPDKQWFLGPMFFLSHWLYARWRHGRKTTIPMMRLAGLPIGQRTDKQCDIEYCDNRFMHTLIDQLKNRFL